MEKAYLEDYAQKEKEENELFLNMFRSGKFSIEKDRYPPDNRFIKLQRPVAIAGPGPIWCQIPFSPSLIVLVPPIPLERFESKFFYASEIPEVINFIKSTGRLQIALSASPTEYVGLDYLQPFFDELRPPFLTSLDISVLGTPKEIEMAKYAFHTFARLKPFNDFLQEALKQDYSRTVQNYASAIFGTYVALKLSHYRIVEDIENLMIDNPVEAFYILSLCGLFITNQMNDLRSDIKNFSLEQLKSAQDLPTEFRPKEKRFPCEIGKFLMKDKLTRLPLGLDACKDVIGRYEAYDLQRVEKALNDGIVTNRPDIVNKNAEEFSEILDNVWNDKTIERRVKGLQLVIPLSMAVIGVMAAGSIGTAGLLAALGYSLADKFIDLGTGGLSEKLAKLKTRNHQANIYEFKSRITYKRVL